MPDYAITRDDTGEEVAVVTAARPLAALLAYRKVAGGDIHFSAWRPFLRVDGEILKPIKRSGRPDK